LKFLNEYEYKIPKIWFYEIKGMQDVATLEEIKNAAEFATNSPFPKDSELYTDVYL